MDISKTQLLPESNVLIGLEGGSRRKILESLSQPLVDSGVVSSKDAFIEDLVLREEQMTTVIAKDIAFPHARTRVVSSLAFVVGILSAGEKTSFSADTDVRIFFLIAIPHISPASHLPLLQFLANFCKNKARIEQLLKAKKPKAVVRALSAFGK